MKTTKTNSHRPVSAVREVCPCGLIKAGFEVLAYVEIDEAATASYDMNHEVRVGYRSDIRELNPKRVMKEVGLKRGELDLLAGCPPCQGFSSHRTRNQKPSVSDPRNQLVQSISQVCRGYAPQSCNAGKMFRGLPSALSSPGLNSGLRHWGMNSTITPSRLKMPRDYGVPQRRRRMILKVLQVWYNQEPSQNHPKVGLYGRL